MKFTPDLEAQQLLDQLERWRDLKLTFKEPIKKGELKTRKEIATRAYYMDLDEEMWSQFIKEFNIKAWYQQGQRMFGQVFESCKGEKRNVVYVHTKFMCLRILTKDHIPVGWTLTEVEYI